MKRTLITLTIIVGAISFIVSQMQRLSVDTSLSSWLENADGLHEATLAQEISKKPIAIFFYTDWCSSCKQLKANVLGTAEIANYMNQFIAVKINPEHSLAEQRIAKQFGVTGYPTFFIKSPGTSVARRIAVGAQTKIGQFIKHCDIAAHLNQNVLADQLTVALRDCSNAPKDESCSY